jgi:23S rRNA pseudouridine1911/1915/1917 synthase
MIILKRHLIPDNISRTRLVDYLIGLFDEYPTRSSIKKAIKRGEIRLNNELTNQAEFITPGQEITLVGAQKKIPKIYELTLEVIYQDDHIAVINKPPGISVSGNKFKTIYNSLPFNLTHSQEIDALISPLPVHRLDFATSGLLLVAKTRTALADLGKQFENRRIKKNYRAIVVGQIPDNGIIDSPVEGQEAYTEYQCLSIFPSLKTEFISLVDLFPDTGRTHQLRKHMVEIGHPIVGDSKYGNDFPLLKGKGLFLSAIGLSFNHPVHQRELSLQIPEPNKFQSLLKRENRRWKKYHL